MRRYLGKQICIVANDFCPLLAKDIHMLSSKLAFRVAEGRKHTFKK